MPLFRLTKRDALRALIAGGEAVGLRAAAQALYELGGRRVLPEVAQRVLRGAVEHETTRLLLGVGMLKQGAEASAKLLPASASKIVAGQAAKAAGMQVLRGIGAAAGAGALIDGAWGAAEAGYRLRKGTITTRAAVTHVVTETWTGAASTAAGAAAAAILVGVTGGIAAPAVFVVGAAAAVGAKLGLSSWLARRSPGPFAVAAEPVAPGVPDAG